MFKAPVALLLLCAAPAVHAGEVLSPPVASASVGPDPADGAKVQVRVRFTEEGRRRFAEFTAAHVGRTVEVLLDGSAASAPMRILTPIPGGELVFYPVPADRAEDDAARLSSGSAAFGVRLLP